VSRVNSWFGSGARTKSGRTQGRADRLPHLLRQLEHGQASRQPGRELVCGHLVQPLPERSGEHHRHVLRAHTARQEPVARSRILERLREQLVENDDLDATSTHDVREGVELLPRPANPDHVVEEQLVAVRGRQPLVREVGSVDHHRAELADLRMRPERGVRRGAHLSLSCVSLSGRRPLSGPTRSAHSGSILPGAAGHAEGRRFTWVNPIVGVRCGAQPSGSRRGSRLARPPAKRRKPQQTQSRM